MIDENFDKYNKCLFKMKKKHTRRNHLRTDHFTGKRWSKKKGRTSLVNSVNTSLFVFHSEAISFSPLVSLHLPLELLLTQNNTNLHRYANRQIALKVPFIFTMKWRLLSVWLRSKKHAPTTSSWSLVRKTMHEAAVMLSLNLDLRSFFRSQHISMGFDF